MNTVAWTVVVVATVIAVATGALVRPLWRASRKVPQMRAGFVVWTLLVTLAATVPVVILVTGRIGWYPRAAGAAGLALAAGFCWTRRRDIAVALRSEDGPTGRPHC